MAATVQVLFSPTMSLLVWDADVIVCTEKVNPARWQGQEVEAMIVSMTTSGADDMPRDASFLLSRNRLNVAISRARCLAVLVASPGLLDLVANSVDQMKLANLFCWAAEFAGRSRSSDFP